MGRSPSEELLTEDANYMTKVINQAILHLIFYEGYCRKRALIFNASQYLDSNNLGYFEPLPKVLQYTGCYQGTPYLGQWIQGYWLLKDSGKVGHHGSFELAAFVVEFGAGQDGRRYTISTKLSLTAVKFLDHLEVTLKALLTIRLEPILRVNT